MFWWILKKSSVRATTVLIITFFVTCLKVSEARSLERDTVESGLTFAGFAVHNLIGKKALHDFLFSPCLTCHPKRKKEHGCDVGHLSRCDVIVYLMPFVGVSGFQLPYPRRFSYCLVWIKRILTWFGEYFLIVFCVMFCRSMLLIM